MTSPVASDPAVEPPIPALVPASKPVEKHPIRRVLDKRVILPLVHLMRMGASPRRLAWSLAIGAAIGINPIVGSTTLLCLLVAFVFRLNLIASQIANHLLFPLQLALVLVYLRAGEILFRTGPLPVATDAFLHTLTRHQWSTAQLLWTWEWHAIAVWLLAAAILTPLLAAALHPLLNRLLLRLHHEAHS